MVRLRPCSPIRAALALVAATSLATAFAPPSELLAQEMPAGVASELVDRALEQQIETPPAASADTPRAWGPGALSAITMALALVMLLIGWARGEYVTRKSTGGDADARADPPGDEMAEPRRRPGGKVGIGRSTSGDAPSRSQSEASPPVVPKEALVLPSHVTEVLQRAAAKRREEAAARDGGEPDPTSASRSEPAGDPAPESLDLVVPGYDPWKGR